MEGFVLDFCDSLNRHEKAIFSFYFLFYDIIYLPAGSWREPCPFYYRFLHNWSLTSIFVLFKATLVRQYPNIKTIGLFNIVCLRYTFKFIISLITHFRRYVKRELQTFAISRLKVIHDFDILVIKAIKECLKRLN